MDRETKTIKTPVEGIEVEMNTYLIGGDKRKLTAETESMKIQEVAIKSTVVRVGDKKEKQEIVSAIDNLHGKDFDFVFTEITKIINDSSFTEKKSD